MCGCSNTIIIIFVTVLIIKVLQKFIWVWDNSPTCLIGKTAIVTGASTGIGFFVAQDLAKRGAKVILGCRNEAKARIAQSKIIAATDNPNVLTYTLDLASMTSIRKFAQHIKNTENKLHILINNAGGLYLDNLETADHINSVKQVNYLGPSLLTVLLLDLLKTSAPSRIVGYGSLMSHTVTVDCNSFEKCNNKMFDYAQSKLLNIMFVNELASRLEGSGVTANSLNPGESFTNITRNLPSIIAIPGVPFRKLFFKTAEEGAQTTIYVAVSKELENVSGKYFDNCREAWFPSMPKIARDKKLRMEIFEENLKRIRLNEDELLQLNYLFKNCKQ